MVRRIPEQSELTGHIERLFSSASEAVVVTDGDARSQRILYVNDSFTRMTGWYIEEVAGIKAKFTQGQRTSKVVLKRFRQSLTDKTDFFGSCLNYRKNGEVYFVEWNVHHYTDPATGAHYFISIQRDLESLKSAFDELKRQRALFKSSQIELAKPQSDKSELLRFSLFRAINEVALDAEGYSPMFRTKNFDEALDTSDQNKNLFLPQTSQKIGAEQFQNTYHIDSETVASIQQATNELCRLLSAIDSANKAEDIESCAIALAGVASHLIDLERFTQAAIALVQFSATISPIDKLNSDYLKALQSISEELSTWFDATFVSQTASNVFSINSTIARTIEESHSPAPSKYLKA